MRKVHPKKIYITLQQKKNKTKNNQIQVLSGGKFVCMALFNASSRGRARNCERVRRTHTHTLVCALVSSLIFLQLHIWDGKIFHAQPPSRKEITFCPANFVHLFLWTRRRRRRRISVCAVARSLCDFHYSPSAAQ